MAEKCKYWTCVYWKENLVDNWQDIISLKFQNPCCYCIHDVKDYEEEEFKWHVHVLLCFPNTTTYNHALSVFKSICVNDNSVNYCERVFNIRYMYDYLIHDTEDAKKKKKHLYNISDRILVNSFDIHFFEQTSQLDKDKMLDFVIDVIREHPDIMDIISLDNYIDTLDIDKFLYREVKKGYRGLISDYYKSNYLRYKFRKEVERYGS